MLRNSRLDHAFLAFAAVVHVAALVRLLLTVPPTSTVMRWIVATALLFSLASLVAQVRARRVPAYFAALGAQIVATTLCVSLSRADIVLVIPLLCALAAGICIHNPFPVAVAIALGATGAVLGVGALVHQDDGADTAYRALVWMSAVFVAPVAVFSSLAIRYRETLIDTQAEAARLDALVDRLTRANLRYQEYATSVGESSTENERKRITRDIHDIVGYTLTNNITMMEAITDTMRLNPLGVAHLVEVARANAQEGLARARDALHQLRGRDIGYPRGKEAILRLTTIFEQATGVRTEVAFTDVPWQFAEELDSALYHVVQESLINSFRHGKATVIRLFLSRENGRILLRVRDNGLGAESMSEGIGLSGMRERLEKLGGDLTAGNAPGGFDVVASVPAAAV